MLNTEAVGIDKVAVLDIPLGENDADAATIRDYLKAQLRTLWAEGESFSGKRPFGNSGWEYDFDAALVKANRVAGAIDEDGDCDVAGRDEVERLINGAIEAL